MSHIILPKIDYITEIKGDLNGYILNLSKHINKSIREVSINYNDKRYVLLFMGFTKEEILDVLNTLVI